MSNFNKLDLNIYWTDYFSSTFLFLLCTLIFVATGNLLSYVIAAIFIYRAGAFAHEIAHQDKNPDISLFKTIWNSSMGAITLMHSHRFKGPHLIHHTTGIFGTKADPQYPLIKKNKILALGIYAIMPFLLPVYNFALCLESYFNTISRKQRTDSTFLTRILYPGCNYTKEERREIQIYETIYSVLFLSVLMINIKIIFVLYLVQVGGWFLSTLRIPLEHELKEYKEETSYLDQMTDSNTITNPLFVIIQPLGLRYHTAHHMYPKVPYHNLAALHEKLLKENLDYAKRITNFR